MIINRKRRQPRFLTDPEVSCLQFHPKIFHESMRLGAGPALLSLTSLLSMPLWGQYRWWLLIPVGTGMVVSEVVGRRSTAAARRHVQWCTERGGRCILPESRRRKYEKDEEGADGPGDGTT